MNSDSLSRAAVVITPEKGSSPDGKDYYVGGQFIFTVRARPGQLIALSVSHSKSVLYGILLWARAALNSPKRRFPARAGRGPARVSARGAESALRHAGACGAHGVSHGR
jgi:hypothetical protein